MLLRIGDLAHEFDHLTASLVQWLEHQQVGGGKRAVFGVKRDKIERVGGGGTKRRERERESHRVSEQVCLQQVDSLPSDDFFTG